MKVLLIVLTLQKRKCDAKFDISAFLSSSRRASCTIPQSIHGGR